MRTKRGIIRKPLPLIGEDGEVRELTAQDLERFKPAAEVLAPSLTKKLGIRTGSKTTSLSSGEMRAARKSGKSLSDWDALHRNAESGVEPVNDPDAPDISALMRDEVARRLTERPAESRTKEQVAISLDKEILAAFRATGSGWQTRINAALREWLKDHTPA